jgi:hypothetical protein
VDELRGAGELEVSAATVKLPTENAARPLPEQVQEVADVITEMVRAVL